MSTENAIKIDAINEQLLAFKLNEIDKAAFMNLLARVAQQCFKACIESGTESVLTVKEKECLNVCFNRRGVAREKLIQAILEDSTRK